MNMNKLIFSIILGIIVTINMMAFPVQAKEALVSDVPTVAVSLHTEESSDDLAEETVIDNDSKMASDYEITDEGVIAEETEEETVTGDEIEEEAGTEDEIEEEADTEDEIEEVTDTEDEIEEEAGTEDEIEEEDGIGDSIEEELAAEDTAEDPTNGESNEIEEGQPEISSAGITEMIPDEHENTPEQQTPDVGSGVEEMQENVDTTVPAIVHARPVIGTSTTGSFVDTDVAYGWSYTYFIATNSSAYRYPYSQTVSKRVRRPIEEIDEKHKIGEDLAWDLPEREKGGDSLVISGNGSMPDFPSPSEIPWRDNAGEIRHISIDNGVTYVGDHSFSDMENLQEVSIPSSVREYGREVFRGSTNLEIFNHDSAVDGNQLHIAVQYLMGVYSGKTFEPGVTVRKGADGEDFDGMPALIRGIDYTVSYNNTTETGEGTIEITFIGDYADGGSVVIPFSVVSELRDGEKIKNVTEIELLPSNSTYTGSAQQPEIIVRSGRWILKEGTDYILTYTDMIDVGSYTVTAQGIGAYSGKVQAVYTIQKQKQSEDPQPPVNPGKPDKPVNPVKPVKPIKPIKPAKPVNPVKPSLPAETQISDTVDFTSQETAKKSAESNEEKAGIEEGESETVTKPEINPESFPSSSDSYLGEGLFGKGDFSIGDSLENKGVENVRFFVGAVGIVASICVGVYFWFFHWLLHVK